VTKAPADAVKELAPTGRLRVALNLSNTVLVQTDAAGTPGGVTVELARELGRRLGTAVDFTPFNAAGKVFEAFKTGALDIAFLAVEPVRAAEVDFTAPYVLIEGVYVVPQNSALKSIADVDRSGVRVGVTTGSAYDLFLTRTLKQAQLLRGTDGGSLFLGEELEAAAGVKQIMSAFVRDNPGLRMLDGRFMEIQQAMGTQKERPAGLRYLRAFVEQMKASGFVRAALDRSGQGDAAVAPSAG
jgi:polar amino acid transport system substrate-binding protein